MRKFLFLLLGALIVGSGSIYAQDKPLVRYDAEAFLKVAKKVDQKKYNDMEPWGEKVFQEYLKHKDVKVDFTESDYKNVISERDALKADKESWEEEKKSLISERDALKGERDNLKASQGKLEEVFTKAQTAINGIYEANKNKSFAEMKEEELNRAQSIYDGLKVLVEYHPLDNDTKDKLNLINAWSQLKSALKESVTYMEGKYNNNSRTTCINKIEAAAKGVNLSDKQLSEKEGVLQALRDQAAVHAKFNELLDYLINDFLNVPGKEDATVALNLIEGKMITTYDDSQKQIQKQIVVKPNPTYHKKHSEALQELRGMMQQAATKGPTKTLQIEGDFRSAMEKIRNKYQ